MKKIKKKIIAFEDWLDDRLKSLLGRISPDGRIIIILVMLFTFSGASIYITVSSIYNMGKRKGQSMQIEHIERLELNGKHDTDSINHLNNIRNERE